MGRALLVLVAMLFAVGAILVRLRARGFSIRQSAKMAALAAGFVVSVKLVLGGYLGVDDQWDLANIRVIALWASFGLAVFFAVATVRLWRQ